MAIVSPLKRVAIFVPDRFKSAEFYESVFGLKRLYEGLFDDGPGIQLVGLEKPATLGCILLRADDNPYGWIGIFQISDDRPVAGPRTGPAGTGEACLVFEAPDLDIVLERAVAAGAGLVCGPLMLAVPNSTTQREMTFRDPWGVLVNVIERIGLTLPTYP